MDQCSLCGEYNSLAAQFQDPAERLKRAELKQEFLDFELPQGNCFEERLVLICADPPAVPAVLLIVDVTGDKFYLDAVKSGVQAAIEGMELCNISC